MAIGVGSGIWVFKPLLESYKESTHGTFRPEDDHHSAPVPSLPFTTLQPGKTADGQELPPAPQEDLPIEPKREV
ncbi:hypothetical protein Rhopal_002572-T1 [Rhodotorula paludigena]|uniref:Uncharacterized protein n=1 Tax=Rhodotorula paludigena TaxID=86838 RepID=A0AAV5GAK5_9BASI|nr:hypothetical protein Rhopal_002572-T1 [Rhodotorula paludigena]